VESRAGKKEKKQKRDVPGSIQRVLYPPDFMMHRFDIFVATKSGGTPRQIAGGANKSACHVHGSLLASANEATVSLLHGT
jgi:hypothetical protein